MFTHEEIWKSLLLRKLFWGKLYFAHLVHSISLGKTFLVFTLTTSVKFYCACIIILLRLKKNFSQLSLAMALISVQLLPLTMICSHFIETSLVKANSFNLFKISSEHNILLQACFF